MSEIEKADVAAYITRPSRMTMDGWDDGEEYAVIASEASDADKRYDVPLMTVAQHNRIIEQYKKDAERYRWLRSNERNGLIVVRNNVSHLIDEKLDSAIDAEMQKVASHD